MKYLIVIAAIAALSACNTVRGAGQDISVAGEAVADTAVETEEAIEQAF